MSALREVRLLQMPVRLWAQAQEQNDALLREFALIATSEDITGHEVPGRLLALMESFDERFAGVADAQELELREAAEAGLMVIEELVYLVPEEAAQASVQLDAMLDEADVYCTEGTLLLTIASTPQVVRFRRWFLSQFVDQIAGKPPVAWPDWP